MEHQELGPRERHEHRRRDDIRIPIALIGVLIAVLMQLGYIAWRDGVQSERSDAARQAAVDTKSQITSIAAKVDTLFQTRLTSRDIDGIQTLIADHEQRIRALERSPRAAP